MDLKEQILVSLGLNKSVKLAWQEKAEDGTIFVSEADELIAGVDISVLTEDGTTILLPVGTYRLESGVVFRVDEDGLVAEVMTEEVVEEEMAEEDESPAEKADWAKSYEELKDKVDNLEDAVADLKSRIGESVDMEDEEEKKEDKDEYEDDAVEVAVEETVVEVVEVVEEAVAEIAAAIDDATPPEVTPDLAAKAAEVAIGIMQEKAEEVAEEVTLSSVDKLNKKIKDLETKLSSKPADSPLNVNKFSSNRNYQVSAADYRKMSKREKFLYDLNK
jgi:hypothetical protein